MNHRSCLQIQCEAVESIISEYAKYVKCTGKRDIIYRKKSKRIFESHVLYNFNQITVEPTTGIIYAHEHRFKIIHAKTDRLCKITEVEYDGDGDGDFQNPPICFDEHSLFKIQGEVSEIHVFDIHANLRVKVGVFIESMTPTRCLFINNHIYVLYWSNQDDGSRWDWEIHMYDNRGKYSDMFCHSPPETKNSDILHFAADRFANIYVSDIGSDRIDKFSPSGERVGFKFIYQPTDIVISKLDELLVLSDKSEIHVLDLNFTCQRSFPVETEKSCMALLPDGRIIAGNDTSLEVFK